MSVYKKVKQGRSRLNENNDCTVIATAIACRISYEKAHAFVKSLGRKNGGGFYTRKIAESLQFVGYNVTEIKKPRQKNGSRYTPKTIGKKLKNGYYIFTNQMNSFLLI